MMQWEQTLYLKKKQTNQKQDKTNCKLILKKLHRGELGLEPGSPKWYTINCKEGSGRVVGRSRQPYNLGAW